MDSTRSASSTVAQTGLANIPTGGAKTAGSSEGPDAYERLQPDDASQAQILRSYQRDASQVGRLTELVSELIRSAAAAKHFRERSGERSILTSGTRWLAHRQTAVDLAVRAVYLLLTFGRGRPTMGEEYTDILPNVKAQNLPPSRRRRLLTILLLLLPSALTSPSMLQYLRGEPGDESRTAKMKRQLVRFIESPIGQSLPELHMVLFMFGGRFYEVARRLTGLGYISDMPPRPVEQRAPSYEPLGLLMAMPLLYRLFPHSSMSTEPSPPDEMKEKDVMDPNPAPVSAPVDSVVVTSEAQFDAPNTYLTAEAQDLPERQCTLCLESRGTGEGSGGTVAVTECGHIFCWGCLGGLDKMECPLCRQSLRMERLVPAYNL